jgi:hypothetical protein
VTTPIPAPRNKALEVIDIVLDNLIEGLGVEVAISAATVAWPFLATLIVRQIFRFMVEKLAWFIDDRAFKLAIKIVIKIQSTERKKEFNESIQPIIAGAPTPEEIERARRAADRLIERNR